MTLAAFIPASLDVHQLWGITQNEIEPKNKNAENWSFIDAFGIFDLGEEILKGS